MVKYPTADDLPTLTAQGVLRGARGLFPVSVFVVPFGLAFGVAAVQSGMTPMQATAMSAMVFSGAAQFATLDFLGRTGAVGSLALVVLALNLRHVIMGAALSPWVNRMPRGRRVVALTFLSDANFADTQPALRAGERDLGRLVGGGLVFWLAWVAGTMLGATGGAVIGDPAAIGVDVVMSCFFAAVVIGMLEGKTDRRSALMPVGAAAVVSIVTLGVMPVGWNVITGALAGGTVAALRDE